MKLRINNLTRPARLRQASGRTTSTRERGVASILAMMFLIIFGSLAAAMAISSRGNIRTASTHVHVVRALGAAETGLQIASARLQEAAQRFIISKSNITGTLASQMWEGNMSGAGTVQVRTPLSSYPESSTPSGLAQAVANRHAADQNVITGKGVSQPTIGNAISGVDLTQYAASGWLYTPVVGIDSGTNGTPSVGYSVTYAPLADGKTIRAIVTGFDFGYTRAGQSVSRTIMQDFELGKKVKQAIVSPSRVLLGKNVLVQGDMGMRYNQLDKPHAEPLVMRSDFRGIDSVLDAKLADFYAGVKLYDADGDNRLRMNHPLESLGIPSNTNDYDASGAADNAFTDPNDNGYIEDFSIFIRHYDKNGDGKVALSNALREGTPAEGVTAEFTGDENLALLIDGANIDRNKNNTFGYNDANLNGRWDDGEAIADEDDRTLGWRDGWIDRKDRYGKVTGRLLFKATQSNWVSNLGAISDDVQGGVLPGTGKSAQNFGVNDLVLPDVNNNMFSGQQSTLATLADGNAFNAQVAAQLGVSTSALSTYVETKLKTSTQPRFERVDPDNNNDGRPDNYLTAYWEKMPFNSPSYTDCYYRPVYQNMTFKNVQIPAGTNALFLNCTFIGVTFVRTTTDNTHVLWSEYGKQTIQTDGFPGLAAPRYVYGDGAGENSYPTMLPNTAIPPASMILMANTPMDKGDIPANQVSLTTGYSALPNPLVVGGLRITDTKPMSNNIRFHDCTIVGSVVSDNPLVFTNVRNKIQFTGKTKFSNKHPTYPDDPDYNPPAEDMAEINKSSMMLPGYSVDVGTFNAPEDQNIQLNGAIIAGLMDIRGNVAVDGALIMTFSPTPGTAPMVDAGGNPVGNPADFNLSIGYFGAANGDIEGLDPATLPIINGKPSVGWDLNADGLADLGPTATPTAAQLAAGAVSVPFNGYGRVQLRLNPTMTLPDGIMLPLSFTPKSLTYREGKP
jgi:Tfp pilus assembly protein PilX